MRIRWKRNALTDLSEIADYIAKENSEAARKVVSAIREHTEQIVL